MPNQNKNLHPLRQNMLERRLQEIEYLERQQARQDDFTTQLYGKRNYRGEKEDILYELNKAHEQNPSKENIFHNISSDRDTFIPAAPDEPSDFDRRKTLWENQQQWEQFMEKQTENTSFQKPPKEQNIFERLNIPDPKETFESISPYNSQNQYFYKWPQPKGASTEEWEKRNEHWRNTPRKDKNGNIIGSELRCNTVFGRELSKLGIDVAKDSNMNTIIEGMELSGDWADLPVDENGNTDHATALKLAQEGYIVAATEKGEKNGHAALLTGQERDSTTWNGKVPEVYGSVRGKTAKAEGISNHWQAKDKNNIKYKIYRYKRPI